MEVVFLKLNFLNASKENGYQTALNCVSIFFNSHNWNGVIHRFFKESSEEERDHAEKLMEYQVVELRQKVDFGLRLFIDVGIIL